MRQAKSSQIADETFEQLVTPYSKDEFRDRSVNVEDAFWAYSGSVAVRWFDSEEELIHTYFYPIRKAADGVLVQPRMQVIHEARAGQAVVKYIRYELAYGNAASQHAASELLTGPYSDLLGVNVGPDVAVNLANSNRLLDFQQALGRLAAGLEEATGGLPVTA